MPVLFCEVEFICLTCAVLFLWFDVVFSLPCSKNFCTLLCILWRCSICHVYSSLLVMNSLSCLFRVFLCHCICCRNIWCVDIGTVRALPMLFLCLFWMLALFDYTLPVVNCMVLLFLSVHVLYGNLTVVKFFIILF